ncbi:MAG: SusC/RagA family TonB-linked outer membrane protein [Bacteroidales bacterium]|jgi:TonB-linked SusC/RagA family outer membrane protein|nr:SusC/RagA family TonB-linked outer membrane protein [Bacteroidales bacterium]
MRKFTILLALMLFIGLQVATAQRTITGKVTSSDDGAAIPGATVLVKGTAVGAITDIDGKFTLNVPKDKNVILVSYVGMKTQEITLGVDNVVNVVLSPSVQELEGVVVTALGIPREKKSLGYATQEVKGDNLTTIKTSNFINNLSGKVSGVQVTTNTNMGGSTNIILRGNKSLTGDNQVLFVIDGVPVNNQITNTTDQGRTGIGYDYGNAASDINPDDIASINVLKGAAATALYGSRASTGVIMITTKKGTGTGEGVARKGIGVTLSTGVDIGWVDKTTFPTYQQQYGAGYGKYYGPDGDAYFNIIKVDGVDQTWVPTTEDASFGAPFDPNLLVYQWDAVDPASPNYKKPTPWVAAKNGPITFFEKPVTWNTTLSIDNSFSKGNYRLSYTNFDQKGLMPNSSLNKNIVTMNGTWNVTDKFTVSAAGSYSNIKGKGRNSTGYSDNIVTSFRQWMETNVDILQQRDMYNVTSRNVTWNYSNPDPAANDFSPIYWDNYYWTRYQNYETDSRNRFFGNLALDYKITSWLDIYGRMSVDAYNELQEERRAVGSIAAPFGIGTGSDGSSNRSDQQSGYLRRDFTFSEYNWDLMANFNKNLSKSFNLKAVLGLNIRRTNFNRLISSTNGGLGVPELYSLWNSIDPLPLSRELASKIGVDGIYASVSVGFKNMVYLDGTIRRDHSSTLPVSHSSYYYPSISGGFIFSQLLPDAKWLSFGKIRLNYAQVGGPAGFDQLINTYNIGTPMNSPITSVASTDKNANLKPEMTNSVEGGIEMNFLNNRLGFDFALYSTNTTNQILPLVMTTATGYNSKYINAGEIQNKGIELTLKGTPCRNKNFSWDIIVNWSKNVNKVVSLYEGVQNLQLGSFQGGVTLNAMVGQPYGVIYGSDYVYDANGNKKVSATTGKYLKTATSNNIIGNVNPKWNGGITNTLKYKNWAFSFLIDVQKGGSIFSLDMYYGMSSGLYPETAYTNDLGNPVRNPIVWKDPNDHSKGYAATSGGYINDGVLPDGTQNWVRVNATSYSGFGYAALPNSAFVYDATYVKLREISLSYTLPSSLLKKTFITGITLTVVASNPWIIYKKIPYTDPESGMSAGNLQGYTTGSLPSTRNFGFNLKFSF